MCLNKLSYLISLLLLFIDHTQNGTLYILYTMTMTMTMITGLLNINAAMYEL